MAGIFPHQWDGGIPPNEQTPDNPANAYPGTPYTQPVDTSPLYYGNGCDIRIRAPVLNAIISEIYAVIVRSGRQYAASSQTNLADAIASISGASEPLSNSNVVELRSEQVSLRTLKTEVEELKKQ